MRSSLDYRRQLRKVHFCNKSCEKPCHAFQAGLFSEIASSWLFKWSVFKNWSMTTARVQRCVLQCVKITVDLVHRAKCMKCKVVLELNVKLCRFMSWTQVESTIKSRPSMIIGNPLISAPQLSYIISCATCCPRKKLTTTTRLFVLRHNNNNNNASETDVAPWCCKVRRDGWDWVWDGIQAGWGLEHLTWLTSVLQLTSS